MPSAYRYGFNGHENLNEFANITGSHLDFGARIYDSRLGRFLSTDPWTDKYAWQTPYAYHRNSPIANLDWKGLGDPPDKEKKKINSAFKKAVGQRIQQDAERKFNSSVQGGYESDDFDSGVKTNVNAKVDVEKGEDPWFKGIGGVHERKWDQKVKLNDEGEEGTAQYKYTPGKDASYNVITKVEFFKNVALPFEGKTASIILFKGKNKRTVGQITFTNQKQYQTFSKQYQKNVKRTVLKLAKEYDVKNGTDTSSRWKKYYSNGGR